MKIKVLHITESIKRNQTPWLFQLLKHSKQDVNHVLTGYYTEKTDNDGDYDLIDSPYNGFIEKRRGRITNRIFWWFLHKFFPYSIKKKLKGKRPDIIHAHFATVGYYNRFLSKLLNIPLVVSFYGYDYESVIYEKPIWEKRYKKLFKIADIILSEGYFGRNKLIELGCPKEKVRVVFLGVNVNNIPFTKREKEKDSLKLVQIANLTEKKGQIYAAKAFIKASKQCPNMHITFVGSGISNIINEIEELFVTNNIKNKLTYLPRIDFNQLYTFLSDFHVFFHPSCYASNMDCEGGAPIVLLDAQAAGLPVISTIHCDIPDEVVHNKTGFLSEEKDIDSLATSIARFYGMNSDHYKKMSEEARLHIEENYDIQKNAKELYHIYSDVINNSL